MPAEPPVKRTFVFVDGQNLFHAAKEAFGYSYTNYDIAALGPSAFARRKAGSSAGRTSTPASRMPPTMPSGTASGRPSLPRWEGRA